MSKPVKEDVLVEKLAQHLVTMFVYEGNSEKSEPFSDASLSLQAPDLAVMPSDWLCQFRQAVAIASPEPLQVLIEQIPLGQSQLAIGLGQRVDRFQFEMIIQCIVSLQNYDERDLAR
ncbi:MAG: hypothetical protein F6K16_36775 [Symploca sp. SIO2B6]|nr:hypothetical protein [Symploca sp. SIO2B6]